MKSHRQAPASTGKHRQAPASCLRDSKNLSVIKDLIFIFSSRKYNLKVYLINFGLFFLFAFQFIFPVNVYTATHENQQNCPSYECCYPVTGNEYPPCAIVDGGCYKSETINCNPTIGTAVIRMELSNFPWCEFKGQSDEQCFCLTTAEDCYNSSVFQAMREAAILKANEDCQNAIIKYSY